MIFLISSKLSSPTPYPILAPGGQSMAACRPASCPLSLRLSWHVWVKCLPPGHPSSRPPPGLCVKNHKLLRKGLLPHATEG